MNKVALVVFSAFDTGMKPSEATESERFYHGFVLGMLVELSDRYTMISNRESSFGRYDVILEPKKEDDGIILEFKVQNVEDEKGLTDTVQAAFWQIEERRYETGLGRKEFLQERSESMGLLLAGKRF